MPAQTEMHRVLRRHALPDGTARDDESLAAFEVEVHTQRRTRSRRYGAERDLRVAGGGGLPFREGHGNGAAGHYAALPMSTR